MPSRREYGSVEEYFEQLRSLLIGLPKAEIDEAVDEMVPHLQTLVAAERDAGAPEDEAVKNAIAKFGEPKAIARKIGLEFVQEKLRVVDSRRSKHTRLRTALFWAGLILVFFVPKLLQEANRAIGFHGASSLGVSFAVLGTIAGIASGLLASADAGNEFAEMLESDLELKQMMEARLGSSAFTNAEHPWTHGPWYKRWALRLTQPQMDKWKETMIASLNQPGKPRKPRINPFFAACWLVWLGILAFLPLADRSFLVMDTSFFLALSVGDWSGKWIRYARSLKRTYGS